MPLLMSLEKPCSGQYITPDTSVSQTSLLRLPPSTSDGHAMAFCESYSCVATMSTKPHAVVSLASQWPQSYPFPWGQVLAQPVVTGSFPKHPQFSGSELLGWLATVEPVADVLLQRCIHSDGSGAS